MNATEVFAIVNTLKIGDSVMVNDWEDPMTVRGVSDNYVLLSNGTEDDDEYSIISKLPNENPYNNIPCGECICAPDFWSFGYWNGYHFADKEWVKEYMETLESGMTEMSLRNRAVVSYIQIIENAQT